MSQTCSLAVLFSLFPLLFISRWNVLVDRMLTPVLACNNYRVSCVVILWSCEPAAHQKHHVPLGALIRQAGLCAKGWGQAILCLGLPGKPGLGRGAPHWPPGYRGSEISSIPYILYLSQASAVGMDGPRLTQWEECYSTFHTQLRGDSGQCLLGYGL